MGKRDQRIDVYINDAPAFAQPILTHIRELMHSACPDVEETMKWSHPHFDYKGIMAGMAVFKQHASFGFWKASIIDGAISEKSGNAHGSFGRLTSVKDLPSKKILTGHTKRAMQLNEEGVTVPKPAKAVAKKKSAAPTVPPVLAAALNRNRKALNSFDAFSPSQRKDYIGWIVEAKTEATRDRRVEQATEWIADGKSRNWKYEK